MFASAPLLRTSRFSKAISLIKVVANNGSVSQYRAYIKDARQLAFCVVGSGPAGFYTVDRLFKKFGYNCRVDIVEQLPTPFGLVRSGVAPDHADTKKVVHHFTELARDRRCSFLGNVRLGRDVGIEELRSRYDAVVLATGAESDRRLAVPGEDLPRVLSAREFVWWYNGHPAVRADAVDLSQIRSVAILGVGNVALDCARLLLSPPKRLEHTDIAEHALKQLRTSAVEHVHLVARRGPAQMACTPKELRELLQIAGTNLHVDSKVMQPSPAEEAEMAAVRMKRRLHETLSKAGAQADPSESARQLHIHFWHTPTHFDGSVSDGVTSVRLALSQGQSAIFASGQPALPAQLVLKSIGYKSEPLAGVGFDEARGVVPNRNGRVLTTEGEHDPRLYVCGWLRRGPSGIIGTNLADAEIIVDAIAHDLQGRTPEQQQQQRQQQQQGQQTQQPDLSEYLRQKGVNIFSYDDWLQLDAAEVEQGAFSGKPREKCVSIPDMLARSGVQGGSCLD